MYWYVFVSGLESGWAGSVGAAGKRQPTYKKQDRVSGGKEGKRRQEEKNQLVSNCEMCKKATMTKGESLLE